MKSILLFPLFIIIVFTVAQAAASFPIDFSLCQGTLIGHPIDCNASVNPNDVLSYDNATHTWKPRSVNGLTYQSTWDARTALPAGGNPGDYYVVSVADGSYGVGDWIVWNGSQFDQIVNSSAVTKVFGRTGNVVATKGDYDLNKLLDVDLPSGSLAVGKVLKYDGSKWVAGDDLSGGGPGSVTAAEIIDGAVTDIKITSVSASKITGTITSAQIADGAIVNADISATAAIDYSKLNIPNTTIPYAKLDIPDGSIPVAKILGLPAVTTVLATSVVDGDTTHAPDGNAVFDALAAGLATKLSLTGGTISTGTISGIPTPVGPTEAVNKDYVDTKDALKVSKVGDTMTGDLTINANLKILGGTNYVTLKAHATSTAYNFIFPIDKGTNGYVLATDGNGNTSWVVSTDVSVKPFAKATLPTCSAGQVLKSDGTNFSCVTDAVGAGAFSGTINSAVITNGSGALAVSATTATELGYVNGVTSAIQTQLNAKQGTITAGTTAQYYRGDKTWATLDTSIVPENGNLYYTDTRARGGVLSTTITNGDTTHAPDGNSVFAALAGKINLAGGGTLTSGTISGIPTPTASDQAANKDYVDSVSGGSWTVTGSDVYRGSGKVGIGGAPSYAFDIVTSATPAMRIKGTAASYTSASMILENGANDPQGVGIYYLDPLSSQREWFWGKPYGMDAMMLTRSATLTSHDQTIASTVGNGVPILTALASGYVGIGTTGPNAVLDVRGSSGLTLKIVDGNQGNGKILTSDANGMASWAGLPTCSAGQVLKANGTAFSCVTDSTGSYTGTASKAVATTAGGALTTVTTTATELGYVSGVTSAIQTQINAKQATIAAGTTAQYYRGDRTWATLNTANVPESGTNYYYTDTRARAAILATAITDGDITHAPNGNVIFDTLATKLNLTGGTLSVGTISGVPTPTATDQAANKAYVDSKAGVAGSDTQIQFNNAGALGATSYLTWDETNKQMVINGYFIGTTATGSYNLVLSNSGSLRSNTTGGNNIAINSEALKSNTTGSENVAVGVQSMRDNTTGNQNTAVGNQAFMSSNGNANIAIGYKTLNGVTGNNNIVIGNNITVPSLTGSNQLNIGGWIYGINNGDIGIGKNNPAYKLDVQGDINATANVRAANIILSSDRRWKRNISPLKNVVQKLMKITGVSYDWARDEYPEKEFSKRKQIGVIAQDVQAVFPELVSTDRDGYLSVNYPALIAPLIEGFKAQQKQIEANQELFSTMKLGVTETLEKHSRAIASIKEENNKIRKENKMIEQYLCQKDPHAPFCH